MAHQLKNPKYFSGFRRSKIPDGIWNGISLGFGLCYMLYQQIHTKICIFFYWCAANKIEFIVQLWYVDKYKTNKGTMVGWSPSLGQSPSNYNLFYLALIRLSKILTGEEFGSQISLPNLSSRLNIFNLSLF